MVATFLLACQAGSGESLQGRILTDDGEPLPDSTLVVLDCGAGDRAPVTVDSTGSFEFPLGAPSGDCFVRITAPGYRAVSMQAHSLPDDPRLPSAVMRRLGRGQGESLSTSHLAAPLQAVESYWKARREMTGLSGYDAASVFRHLEAAVSLYPGYAQAWFEIGRLHLALDSTRKAISAFEMALQADPWFVSPYQPLLLLLRATSDPTRAAEVCKDLRRINPALPPDCGPEDAGHTPREPRQGEVLAPLLPSAPTDLKAESAGQPSAAVRMRSDPSRHACHDLPAMPGGGSKWNDSERIARRWDGHRARRSRVPGAMVPHGPSRPRIARAIDPRRPTARAWAVPRST